MQTAVTDVAKELDKERPRASGAPAPVIVRSEPSGRWQLPAYVEYAGAAAAVIVLVIFMLIEREDLRNRVIRLGGYERLTTTTRVLDEAAYRISRYLLMTAVVPHKSLLPPALVRRGLARARARLRHAALIDTEVASGLRR